MNKEKLEAVSVNARATAARYTQKESGDLSGKSIGRVYKIIKGENS